MPTQHTRLLALAGAVSDGWLVVAREALAAGDAERLTSLFDALAAATPAAAAVPDFAAGAAEHSAADRAVVALAAELPITACWRVLRGGTDAVHLVQADEAADLPAVTAAVQAALEAAGEAAPRAEVFGPTTALPAYHEAALLAATLLWSAEPAVGVRIARTFDGATPDGGPFFAATRELVVDVDERQRLLDFLGGGEVVAPLPGTLRDLIAPVSGAVPVDLRSDGEWVWSDAARYYLDRHMVAPDPELARHAAERPGPARLSHLDRHRVRAALAPAAEGGPLWRAS
ncbi:hypothetical protein [Actinokineospora bangkokensis]|uniref:Uncharacterized protein n=1 Tax=Actinokineospora bangkokensis TaxID=1193682 RepID=A0A1Q9LMU6_9PSEU|nr:hypothetical protein [Actinokineospora bangkokensis]OLR93335.1 hypothetical protein BJP25_17850 [Actinokineospora bangkokensis]